MSGLTTMNAMLAESTKGEEEARQMLASHAGQVKEMDHYKMFLLIKQKLAQKKEFVL